VKNVTYLSYIPINYVNDVRKNMGIRKRADNDWSEFCPCCGLEISIGEYAAMKGLERDVVSYTERQKHCDTFHVELIKKQKNGTYNYGKTFSK
jgi:hypothetical protein